MMNKTLYILLVVFLFQGCSVLSKRMDDTNLLNEEVGGEDIASIEDSLLHTDLVFDSLSIDTLALFPTDTILVEHSIIISDIFNIVPAQKVAYGDTLELDLSDYVISNFTDIDLVDSKNFNVYISDDLILEEMFCLI